MGDQPTYDRNEVISLMSRFRHPSSKGSSRMPDLARAKCRAFGSWGHGSRCRAVLLQGTYERCGGDSTDRTDSSVVTDDVPTVGWKLLEQGPKSQATSGICSVGPSSVMDASDLDGLTLVIGHAQSNQPSCSLLCGSNSPTVKKACCLARGSRLPATSGGCVAQQVQPSW